MPAEMRINSHGRATASLSPPGFLSLSHGYILFESVEKPTAKGAGWPLFAAHSSA
jgi:hypothetical protein